MATSSALLDAISTSVVDYLNKSKTAENTTTQAAQRAGQITAESEGVLRQVAVDQAAIVRQQQTAELEAQNMRRSAALKAGTDPTTGAGTMLDLIGEIGAKTVKTRNALEQYNKEQTTRLIDDPVTWIKAQVDWDKSGEKLAASAKELEFADKSLGVLNSALQQTARTSEVLKESVTAATVEASTRIAAADATLKAQTLAIEGLKYNSAETQAAATGSKERLAAMYDILGATRAEETQKMALESLALQREKFSWDKEERNLVREARAQGKLADDLSLQYINASLGSFGQPIISAQEAQTQLQLFKTGASKDLAYHYQNGRRIAMTGVSMVGNTPAEAVEVLTQVPSQFPAARAEVATLLAAAQQALNASKSPMHTDVKGNEGSRAKFINEFVGNQITSSYQSIAPNSGNLFDVGDLSSYIGRGPENPGISSLQNLAITQKLLAPAIAAGQPLNDPKIVMGLTIESVRRGDLTASEATLGITEIYRRANLINQAARGFKGFGIVPPNAGANYNAKLGPWGGTVDLTNPTDLNRYMSKELSQAAFKDYQGQSLGLRDPVLRTLRKAGEPGGMSFGAEITNTPEKYKEGQQRLSDYLKGQ